MTDLKKETKKYIKSLDIPQSVVNNPYRLASKAGLIDFYKQQLQTFQDIGVGNYTKNKVKVTYDLIHITVKRLEQLSLKKSLRSKW